MTLSPEAKCELWWWIDNVQMTFAPLRQSTPQHEIRTDASGIGWGATDLTTNTGGRWNSVELLYAQDNRINYLETRAALLGLQSLCSDLHGMHILVRVDNVTAVSYINSMGGTRSNDCNKAAKDLWMWCKERDIWVTAA